MSAITIRAAKSSDCELILSLFKEFLKYLETSLNLHERTVNADDHGDHIQIPIASFEKGHFTSHLAESASDGPLGLTISATTRVAFLEPILTLTLIYVKKTRQGLGKALLAQTMRDSDLKIPGGFREVHFLFNEDNDFAWDFYKRYNSRNLTKEYGVTIYEFSFPEEIAVESLKVHFRAAKDEDRSQVLEILKEFRDTCSSPFWVDLEKKENSSRPMENLLIAESLEGNANVVIGLLSYGFRYSGMTAHTPVVYGLFVKEPYRRRNIGTALLNHLGQICSKDGCTRGNALIPAGEKVPGRCFFKRFPNGIDRTAQDTWNYCMFSRPSSLD